MWSFELLFLIFTAFLLAGIVKGVIGFGLPTVTLTLLTATVGLREAMVLLLVPCLVTNLWQAIAGGHLLVLVKRLWTLLLGVCMATWLGASWHAQIDPRSLVALLGVLLAIYAIVSLLTPPLPAPSRYEAWLSPHIGLAAGLLNGLTGSFVVPGVIYLQALGLPRDTLIQAMGILFMISSVALGLSLHGNDLLPREFGILSAAAVIPALVGMRLGLRVRRRLEEQQFRQIFFASLLFFGIYLLVNSALR
jgi:uncharacterized protein